MEELLSNEQLALLYRFYAARARKDAMPTKEEQDALLIALGQGNVPAARNIVNSFDSVSKKLTKAADAMSARADEFDPKK